MNTHPSYTLASRPQTSRFLRVWALLVARHVLRRHRSSTDVALIVAMSCFTGIAYHLVVYDDPGDISSFLQVGVLAASIFAISNVFRGEYRLPNFFAFKSHARRTIQLWNVTLICLLMLGFLTQQITVDYSRGWIVLFYCATLAGLIVLRFVMVRVTELAREAGLISTQADLSDRHRREYRRFRQSLRTVDARRHRRRLPLSDAGRRRPHRRRRGAKRSIATSPKRSRACAASSPTRSSC